MKPNYATKVDISSLFACWTKNSTRQQIRRSHLFHVRCRVDWFLALTQLEMDLRLVDCAGFAGLGNRLATGDFVTALHQQLLVVGVRRHPAALVAQQD
jgi:hypothetical protein